jgi:hypothetical protein
MPPNKAADSTSSKPCNRDYSSSIGRKIKQYAIVSEFSNSHLQSIWLSDLLPIVGTDSLPAASTTEEEKQFQTRIIPHTQKEDITATGLSCFDGDVDKAMILIFDSVVHPYKSNNETTEIGSDW